MYLFRFLLPAALGKEGSRHAGALGPVKPGLLSAHEGQQPSQLIQLKVSPAEPNFHFTDKEMPFSYNHKIQHP